MREFINLLTPKQVVHVYGFAGMTKDKLPRKNQETVLRSPIEPIQFVITKTNLNATYGGKLYSVRHARV